LRRLLLTLLTAGALIAGCQYPRDPEGTLDRVEGGTMRVGVIESDPWVKLGGEEPRGVEPGLLREFAEQIDADIEWVEGGESDLIAALEGYQLDVVIGGLTRDSPQKKLAALTRPYVEVQLNLALPPGTDPDDLPPELNGETVYAEAHSEEAAIAERETDAEVQSLTELTEADGPVITWSYLIDDLGLEKVGSTYLEAEHAMAVPKGENAWLVELEHFLLDRGEEAEQLLAREGKP
jgi:polar amino acid transport system substrate-binding protein